MIGKSPKDLVLIISSITSLRLIAPASIVYLVVCACYQRLLISPWFAIYPIVEASFFLFVYLPRRLYLQKATDHPPPLDRHERRVLLDRCLSHINGNEYPYRWFSSTDIKRDNMVEWLLWAIFSSDRANASPEWHEEIDGYITSIEASIGKQLPSGYNPAVKSMRVTLDPVVMVHRPMLWYAIVATVDVYTSISLYRGGFTHFTPSGWFRSFPPRPLTYSSRTSPVTDIPYWYRPSPDNKKLPVVFIHGIGIGLYPYVSFLRELATMDVGDDTAILAIELLPISARITSPMPDRASLCRSISRILASHDIDRFVLVGNSYGTVMTAHMLKFPNLGDRVAATLLIDPIPFLLHLPSVAYNFLYRQPRTANEWQLWYFASRDADVAHSLSRNFFWTESVLWREDLEGKPTAVALGGDDQIVDAEEVRKYLTREDNMKEIWEEGALQVLFYPGLDHSMIFDTKDRRFPLLNILRKFVLVDQHSGLV